jgi:hypothetical protein
MGPTQRPKKTFPQPPALEHHGPARVVAQVGEDPVVQLCRPLRASDAPVLLILLLFVSLVLPDFTKVSIAGFLDLERKVEKQEERTREVERSLNQMQANLNQEVSLHLYGGFLGPEESVPLVLERLRQREGES